MVDARVVLQPTDTVTWRANARYERQDYDGTYWMYNPLTGQWGYPAENGSQGSVVPGESGIWDPILSPGAPTRIRNLPLDRELRSEEHTSELQSLMRISYAVFRLKKKKTNNDPTKQH